MCIRDRANTVPCPPTPASKIDLFITASSLDSAEGADLGADSAAVAHRRLDDRLMTAVGAVSYTHLRRRKRDEKIGKFVVFGIAGLNAAGSLASWIVRADFTYLFTFLVQAGFSIALCCGVRWVRWLFVAGGVIGAASTFLLLIQAADIGGMPAWFFAYGIFVLLVSVLTGILLAWYRPVKEFFYQKKNG